jgi:signal peptidase I
METIFSFGALMEQSKKATWKKAILTFLTPIVVVFFIRWALFEPYVIPSGSMIPTLLVHDHILVNKWAYGFRLPFTESWLSFWRKPLPGEIVVFRFPRGRDTFYVKRVVAVEGDTIEVIDGQLVLNGVSIERVAKEGEDKSEFQYYSEKLGTNEFTSRSFKTGERMPGTKHTVPSGHFFVVGDNRDESYDSRGWGFVPIKNLIGRASSIWLSCENTLPATPFICDPKTIRWKRIFTAIH